MTDKIERGSFVTERKLLSAFITSLAAFFILPMLYSNQQDDFLTSALNISMYSFPLIFTYGLIISYVSDFFASSKRNISGVSFLFHSLLGSTVAVPIFIYSWMNDEVETAMQPEIWTAGFTLGAIFFTADVSLKYLGKYLVLNRGA